jgi:hypothetical protein
VGGAYQIVWALDQQRYLTTFRLPQPHSRMGLRRTSFAHVLLIIPIALENSHQIQQRIEKVTASQGRLSTPFGAKSAPNFAQDYICVVNPNTVHLITLIAC